MERGDALRSLGGRRGAARSAPRCGPCGRALLAALVLGALALGACRAAPSADVVRAVAGIEPGALREHVEAICALGPRPGADEARSRAVLDLLRGRLEPHGWQVHEEPFEHPTRVARPILGAPGADGAAAVIGYEFEYPERTHWNLIAELRGSVRPDLVIELGAHYDTLPPDPHVLPGSSAAPAATPGADDNASGMAVLLEVAGVLGAHPPTCTVRLCFFALEEEGEEGFMPGSDAHVRRMSSRERAALQAVIVLDMVGYRDRAPGSQRFPLRIPLLLDPPRSGDFLLVLGRGRSARDVRALRSAARRYAPDLCVYGVARLSWLSPDSLRSDHASYWRAGLPALLLTDTAEYRNPHYHGPGDLPETLDYDFMAAVGRALCAWLIERCLDLAPPPCVAPSALPAVPGSRRRARLNPRFPPLAFADESGGFARKSSVTGRDRARRGSEYQGKTPWGMGLGR